MEIEILEHEGSYRIRAKDKSWTVDRIYPHTIGVFLKIFFNMDPSVARKYGFIAWKLWKAAAFSVPFKVEVNIHERDREDKE